MGTTAVPLVPLVVPPLPVPEAAVPSALAVEFNLSAAVVKAFWLAISAYGLARDLNRRSRPTPPPSS